MVTQRGATSGERAQRVHGGGPKATHSVLVPQCCEPGVVRLLEVQTHSYPPILQLPTILFLSEGRAEKPR